MGAVRLARDGRVGGSALRPGGETSGGMRNAGAAPFSWAQARLAAGASAGEMDPTSERWGLGNRKTHAAPIAAAAIRMFGQRFFTFLISWTSDGRRQDGPLGCAPAARGYGLPIALKSTRIRSLTMAAACRVFFETYSLNVCRALSLSAAAFMASLSLRL